MQMFNCILKLSRGYLLIVLGGRISEHFMVTYFCEHCDLLKTQMSLNYAVVIT